ncbi:MAG: copper resistance CopC/CopD family protein [Candidatus Dormibacteria bacterium]
MSLPAASLARRGAVATFMALAASAAAAAPALAHASLSTSSPAAHAQVSGNPPYVDIRFSSVVVGAEQIQVHDGTGHGVATGPTEVLDGGRRMRARIPTLRSGDYIVDWRALSADGHLSLGRYGFSVGVAGSQVGTSGNRLPVLEGSVRWVYLMALLVAFGALLTRAFTWAGIKTAGGRGLPAIPLGPVLTVATFGAMAQAALQLRRAGFDLGQAPVQVALLQAALVLICLWLVTRETADRVLLGFLGVAVVVAALGGHSVASRHWWGGPANAVHLLAVATWTGGLAQVALVGWRLRAREDLATLLAGARRYARFALISVVLAILTGLLSAAAEFGTLSQLVDSGYGRVLLVKVALVGVTLALALVARLGGLPTRRPERPALLRRMVRAESAVLATVIAAAALLANTAPPAAAAVVDLVPVPQLKGPRVDQADFDGRYMVQLAVNSDTVLVQVQDSAGHAPAGVKVDVFTVTPDYDDLNVYPRPCGGGCATGDYPLQPGNTAFLVVTRAAGRETSVAFSVHWPPRALDPGQQTATRAALARQPSVHVTQQRSNSIGTSPLPTVDADGPAAVRLLGLDDPSLVALPYQPRTDQLLLRNALDSFVELDLDASGAPVHEVVTMPGGRVERFVG